MSKRNVVGIIAVGVLLVGALNGGGDKPTPEANNLNSNTSNSSKVTNPEKAIKKVAPTCDGKTITKNCKINGVTYKSYVYHPAIAKKTHKKSITTYREKVTGYCTLCNDGSYSPTCATGRGACSWHGGVAEWNAPMISKVPVTKTKTIVDRKAKKAYYEKVLK